MTRRSIILKIAHLPEQRQRVRKMTATILAIMNRIQSYHYHSLVISKVDLYTTAV